MSVFTYLLPFIYYSIYFDIKLSSIFSIITDRWSARQLLSHPWITAGDEELQAKDLTKSIEAMKKYKAKLRFKAVTNAIIMTNRMKGIFKIKKDTISGDDTQGAGPVLSTSSSEPTISKTAGQIGGSPGTNKDPLQDGFSSDIESGSNTEPATPTGEADGDLYVDRKKEVVKEVAVRKKKNTISAASVRQSMMDEVSELEEDMSHMTACID